MDSIIADKKGGDTLCAAAVCMANNTEGDTCVASNNAMGKKDKGKYLHASISYNTALAKSGNKDWSQEIKDDKLAELLSSDRKTVTCAACKGKINVRTDRVITMRFSHNEFNWRDHKMGKGDLKNVEIMKAAELLNPSTPRPKYKEI